MWRSEKSGMDQAMEHNLSSLGIGEDRRILKQLMLSINIPTLKAMQWNSTKMLLIQSQQ